MPTEHEFKYILSLELPKEYTEDQLKVICSEHRIIEQGAICHGPGMYLRIRKVVVRNETQWFMTFKLKDATRTIEIENPIDSRDGLDLWRRCYWTLSKDRYIYEEDGLKWEIDFFKNGEDLYFVMAEIELPEGHVRPTKIPSLLKQHLLYEVPLTDDRFSNRKLGNVEYASSLYSQLLDLKSQGIADEE